MARPASVVERQVFAAALQADRTLRRTVMGDGHAATQADLLEVEARDRALAGADGLLRGNAFVACLHVRQQLLGGGLVDVAAVHGRTGQQLQRDVVVDLGLRHQHADDRFRRGRSDGAVGQQCGRGDEAGMRSGTECRLQMGHGFLQEATVGQGWGHNHE